MLCKETGKSGVNSRLIPFIMKGLFCVTLTDWPSFGVWRGGSWLPGIILANGLCTGRKVACAPVAQSTWARRPCRNTFPHEKETRKLEASFCLCDKSQGEKASGRYWPKVLWPLGGFIEQTWKVWFGFTSGVGGKGVRCWLTMEGYHSR